MRRAAVITLVLLPVFLVSLFSPQIPTGAAFRALPDDRAREVLGKVSNIYGPQHAWALLKESYLDENGLNDGEAVDLHVLAHFIGGELYEYHGADGILECDSAFTDGCYHGSIERMIVDLGTINEIGTLCAKTPNPLSCEHAAGHGLNEANGSDLAAALADCEQVALSGHDDCSVGVFMDNSHAWNEDETRRDPWHKCMAVSSYYRVACAASLPERLKEVFSVLEIAAVCQRAESSAMADRCMSEVGYLVERLADGDTDIIEKECGRLQGTPHDLCFYFATNLYLQKKHAGWQEKTPMLCNKIAAYLQPKCLREYQESLRIGNDAFALDYSLLTEWKELSESFARLARKLRP